MTKVEKLINKLKSVHGINLNISSFKRLYTGIHQKRNGAWSWTIQYVEHPENDFGSQYTVTECLKNFDKIVIYENEILIENK